MGCGIKQTNQTEDFNALGIDPIFLNDIPIITEEDREAAQKLTSIRFDHIDTFSNEPQCQCGEVKGGYNIGVICKSCKTAVTDVVDEKLESRVWIRSPRHISSLINPHSITLMRKIFKIRDFSIVEWLMDTSYNASRRSADLGLDELLGYGIERGYNYFVNNFDKCIDAIHHYMFNRKGVHKKRQRNPNYVLDNSDLTVEELVTLLKRDKNTILTQYIAVPSKVMMIIENTSTGVYIDPVVIQAKDAINTIQGIDTYAFDALTVRARENRIAKVLVKLSKYYEEFISTALVKKGGLYRRQIFGLRTHFSMRCVISALTDPHEYDELHLPWKSCLSTFKLHLASSLYRRGYMENEIFDKLMRAFYTYDQEISDIFDELLKDYGGYIPVYWNRNPSLRRGSYILMRVTKIKRDIEDYTVSHPATTISGLNCDNCHTKWSRV